MSSNNTKKPRITNHQKFSRLIQPSIPLLLHGSDTASTSTIPPIDPDTCTLIADLTTTYIQKLVYAAVDAHDILTDGGGGILPPPPYISSSSTKDCGLKHQKLIESRLNKEYKLVDPGEGEYEEENILLQGSGVVGGVSGKKRPYDLQNSRNNNNDDDARPISKLKQHVNNWEEPLPIPKIKQNLPNNDETNITTKKTITTNPRGYKQYQAHPTTNTKQQQDDDEDNDIPHNEWIGAQGINLLHNRIRSHYASKPTSISTNCFIYPICHDAQLYNRVNELQTFSRNLVNEPILLDPVIVQCMQEENDAVVGQTLYSSLNDTIPSGGGSGRKFCLSEMEKSIVLGTATVGSSSSGKNSKSASGKNSKAGPNTNSNNNNLGDELTSQTNGSNNEKMNQLSNLRLEKQKELARRVYNVEAEWPGLDDILPIH